MDYERIMKLIMERRSIRRFNEKKVERKQLKILVEAATWAPSGSNAQAWQFIVLDDEVKLKRLTAFLPGITQCPAAMICLCVDYKREIERAGKLGKEVLGIMDISMAAQNIMLTATSMQLGSCAIRGFSEEVVAMALNLPKNVKPELIVIIGYSEQPIRIPNRKSLEEVLHWQKYNSKSEVNNE